jgi:hypothetical protein
MGSPPACAGHADTIVTTVTPHRFRLPVKGKRRGDPVTITASRAAIIITGGGTSSVASPPPASCIRPSVPVLDPRGPKRQCHPAQVAGRSQVFAPSLT